MFTRFARWTRGRYMRFVAVALCTVAFQACATSNGPLPGQLTADALYVPAERPFDISLVPAVPVPIRLGTNLGFRISSGSAGYASLYLINSVNEVSVLAENLPVAAGNIDYPSPAQGFTLAATEPLGANRVLLLVTRSPITGFSGGNTLSTAVLWPSAATFSWRG